MRKWYTTLHRLDFTLGGLPYGLVELAGKEQSGKTILARYLLRNSNGCVITTLTNTQREYFACTSVLAEYGELVFASAFECIDVGANLVVIDSLPYIAPACNDTKSVLEPYFQTDTSRLLYHGLYYLRQHAISKQATVLVINDIRANIHRSYGDSRERSYENRTMEALADLRLKASRTSFETKYGRQYKSEFLLKADEASSQFTIHRDGEIHEGHELLMALLASGASTGTGAHWKCYNTLLGPGYDNASAQIEQNLDYWRAIMWERNAYGKSSHNNK